MPKTRRRYIILIPHTVHISLLFVALVAGGILTLVLVTFFKEGPDEGEYLSRIHDLECRLASEQSKKNGYKKAYNSLRMDPKYVDVAGEGAARIVKERIRQKVSEGWTPEHDARHMEGQLSVAAACYAVHDIALDLGDGIGPFPVGVEFAAGGDAWPWATGWDKRRKHSRMRRLEIAGALIAAEIDRLVSNPHPMATAAEKEVTL
jgi:hypothetical protein